MTVFWMKHSLQKLGVAFEFFNGFVFLFSKLAILFVYNEGVPSQ